MARMLKVAVLGAGKIGRFHAQTLARKIPHAQLAVVVDVSEKYAQEVSEAVGAPRWSTHPAEVIGDPTIGAVVIATPDGTHADLITSAAVAGKHVFCEKPIALDPAEIDAALAAVRAAGVKLQIGFQRRFDSGYARARQLIQEGRIGNVQMVQSRTRDPQLDVRPEALRDSSGLFHSTAVHDFDVVRFLSGAEVEEVYAVGAALVDPMVDQLGKVDTAVATLRLSNGAVGSVDISLQSSYGYDVRAEVLGSEGGVQVSLDRETPVLHLTRQGACHDYPYWYLDRFGAAYEAELRTFVECVLADAAPPVTGEDGRAATVIAIAANRSLSTGLPVRVADVEELAEAREGVGG